MKGKEKKRARNVYAFDDQWNEINRAQREAHYSTLSEFMVDRAISGPHWLLGQVAFELGRLGMICNEVLTSQEPDDAPRLGGEDAILAVEKIIKACDAVADILRKT